MELLQQMGNKNSKQNGKYTPKAIHLTQNAAKELLPEQIDYITRQLPDKLTHSMDLRGKWKQSKMDLVCKYIKQWQISSLIVDHNSGKGGERLLADIININFSHLKILNLSNTMRSLENIDRLEAPVLENLHLGFNFIVSVKSLRKANFPQLIYLNLEYNAKTDLPFLCEAPFSALINLRLQMDTQRDSCVDVGWLAKLPSSRISHIDVYGYYRIGQQSLYRALILKWKRVMIGHHRKVR